MGRTKRRKDERRKKRQSEERDLLFHSYRGCWVRGCNLVSNRNECMLFVGSLLAEIVHRGLPRKRVSESSKLETKATSPSQYRGKHLAYYDALFI